VQGKSVNFLKTSVNTVFADREKIDFNEAKPFRQLAVFSQKLIDDRFNSVSR
jgi:hypothetical protein